MAAAENTLTAKELVETGATVTLPLHLEWTEPGRPHALSDRRQLIHVYEVVLREGSASDVRRYVDPDTLAAIWDDVVLPAHIRRAWADYFQRRRHLRLDPFPEARALRTSGD